MREIILEEYSRLLWGVFEHYSATGGTLDGKLCFDMNERAFVEWIR